MRKLILLAIATAFAGAAMAQFQSNRVRFLANLQPSAFNFGATGTATSGSGCSGYVSASGREYAIIGLSKGNAVVEITNPSSPVIVANVPGRTSQWHEVAVQGNYAYAVTEAGGGMQIIDLSNVDNGVVTLAATYTGGGLTNVHTVQASPSGDAVFLHGSTGSGNQGIIVLDVTNPTAPVQKSAWNTKYAHDVTYHRYTSGQYAGREFAFACCGRAGLYIIELTDRTNPVVMGSINYIQTIYNQTNKGYCHSGVLSPDEQFFYINDEYDESDGVEQPCTTHKIAIKDLANPTYAGKFTNNVNSIDHNSMVQNGFMMLAAYKAGLRVYDARGAFGSSLSEKGFFDTHPEGSGVSFNGAWGVYAGFPSGTVIISDIERGLFVLDPSEAKGLGAPVTAVSPSSSTTTEISQVRYLDGNMYSLGGSTVDVTLTTSATTRTQLTLQYAAQARRSASMIVELKNVTNGSYEMVSKMSLGSTLQSERVEGLLASKYVDNQGRIFARLRFPTKARNFAGSLDVLRADIK